MIFIDIIQIIVSIIFTRYLDMVKNIIPSFADLNIFVRIILYLVPVVLVGIGTVIAMLLVGRVMHLFDKIIGKINMIWR